jgi:hypothetical protein
VGRPHGHPFSWRDRLAHGVVVGYPHGRPLSWRCLSLMELSSHSRSHCGSHMVILSHGGLSHSWSCCGSSTRSSSLKESSSHSWSHCGSTTRSSSLMEVSSHSWSCCGSSTWSHGRTLSWRLSLVELPSSAHARSPRDSCHGSG